jgi:hypothetical protein
MLTISLQRDILKQMSLEAKNSNWDITSADMETLFNYHNEVMLLTLFSYLNWLTSYLDYTEIY